MSQKNQPLVSFIILNYNQIKVTCEFLESLKDMDYDNYEVILVDNYSKENPLKIIREKYPKVIFIRSEQNLGFTGGNNLGYSYSKGKFVFIINNDTEVTQNLLNSLIKVFEQDHKIGVVCPKIKYFDNPDIIQYAGFNPINKFTGRNSAVGNGEKDIGQFTEWFYTNYAHGAAMLVKREVIEEVGLFPDFFFIYYEELDFSARVEKAGYKIAIEPNAEIFHKESITMGKESPMKTYYMNRNRILFMRRNYNFGQLLIFILFFMFASIPKNIYKYTKTGRFDLLSAFLRGISWNLINGKNGKI